MGKPIHKRILGYIGANLVAKALESQTENLQIWQILDRDNQSVVPILILEQSDESYLNMEDESVKRLC